MANLDIKAKHLEWVGDIRFVCGFFRGDAFIHLIYTASPRHIPSYLVAICQKPCPIKTSLKVSTRQAQGARDLPIRLAYAGKRLEDMLG